MRRLSSRLSALIDALPFEEHVFDLACDHGIIGEGLLAQAKANSVTFVDRVPLIIEKLKRRHRSDSTIDPAKCSYLLADICALKERHTIQSGSSGAVVAGVGGHLASRWVLTMQASSFWEQLSYAAFLVHQHPWYFRQVLAHAPGSLAYESLVECRGRVYQLLVFRPSVYGRPVEYWGDRMWSQNPIAARKAFFQLQQMLEYRKPANLPMCVPTEKILKRILDKIEN